MAPKIPDSVSEDEAGAIQPLAIGVQIGKRVDLRAHQTIAIMGCGPIGLIAAAVAHAYSARKIIAYDNSPSRVDFARKYISPITGKPIIDHVFLNEPLPSSSLKKKATNGLAKKLGEEASGAGVGEGEIGVNEDEHDEETEGDRKWEWAKVKAAEYIEEAGLSAEEGVDRVIEASGAEDCGFLGVALAKQGGICEWSSSSFFGQWREKGVVAGRLKEQWG